MTGLTNPASDGDLLPQPQLSDLDVIVEPQSASPPAELDPWRDEVAARLARYRARRKPRAPRYPSLLLPFESSETWHRALAAPSMSAGTVTQLGANPTQDESEAAEIAYFTPVFESATVEPSLPASQPAPYFPPESTAKIIEFPRSAAIPILHTSNLADPIFDRPRIVEAPEVVTHPPALGGILIEPAPARPAENRIADAGIQSASVPRRLLATAVDGLILIASLSAFAAIFLRLNSLHSPLLPFVRALAAFAVALWFVYQYLFIVYTGSTLGLRAAGLKLTRFDGSPVPRRLRRWRVLASMLSGFSAGLGYLWCFLDSDSLCWHDRITRTHLLTRK